VSRHEANAGTGQLGCGFGIREGEWKLIQGYGGSPDGWCNTSQGTPSDQDGWSCRKVANETHACPGGWCLFDVEADPLELNECSESHPDVAKRLQGQMAIVLQSYTEYEEDKACPAIEYAQDPVVGKAWQPWC